MNSLYSEHYLITMIDGSFAMPSRGIHANENVNEILGVFAVGGADFAENPS